MMLQTKSLLLIAFLSTALLGCGAKKSEQGQADEKKNGPKPTLISVTHVKKQAIDITEQSVGSLEGLTNPTVSSEVAAKVIRVHVNIGQAVKQGQLIATLDATDFSLQIKEAQAEVARIEALLNNQNKIVERNQVLVAKKFISQNALDNDSSQQAALNEQYEYGDILYGPVVAVDGTLAESSYSTSLSRLKQWITFLRNCGGFKIW